MPRCVAIMATHFYLQLHENWTEREVDDAIAIFRQVDAYYRKS